MSDLHRENTVNFNYRVIQKVLGGSRTNRSSNRLGGRAGAPPVRGGRSGISTN